MQLENQMLIDKINTTNGAAGPTPGVSDSGGKGNSTLNGLNGSGNVAIMANPNYMPPNAKPSAVKVMQAKSAKHDKWQQAYM